MKDDYIREHWDEIDAICKLNGIPFNPTGEIIHAPGAWRVHEFEWQLDAIQFWDAFEGRWLRGNDFLYPAKPKDLPELKRPKFKSVMRGPTSNR